MKESGGNKRCVKLFIRSLFCFSVMNWQTANAQFNHADTIFATALSNGIVLDGKLDETAWTKALPIENFSQRELDFGMPATEITRTAVVYDETAIYIGLWCYQKGLKSIHAKFMQRDFDYDQDDNFQVAISTFNDRRNGYLFVINPNGARADLLISGNEEANKDWNGV